VRLGKIPRSIAADAIESSHTDATTMRFATSPSRGCARVPSESSGFELAVVERTHLKSGKALSPEQDVLIQTEKRLSLA
jgi:hypothetical protein